MSADPASQVLQTLYVEHRGWLHAWLRRKLGCDHDAADLVHDTFVRVLHGRDPATIREPRPYLGTVAHGLMVNHLRRRDLERAYREALQALPEATVPSLETQAELLETLVRIDTMLHSLPARVRQAFLANQLDGQTHAQIATTLGVSISSVRQYVAKALRHCLEIVG